MIRDDTMILDYNSLRVIYHFIYGLGYLFATETSCMTLLCHNAKISKPASFSDCCLCKEEILHPLNYAS